MESIFANLSIGFIEVFKLQPVTMWGMTLQHVPFNIFMCLIGCLLGTLIGVLPGIGPVATIAMLLPVTYALPPVAALIMLAGIYYGAQYGGSTTAILVNLPGEANSVATTLDGYAMAQRGRGGANIATTSVATLPATNEPMAAVASAGPARPWRAIW